jgi:chromosome segregation ATPase
MYDKKRVHEENKEDDKDDVVWLDDIAEEVTSPPSPTSITKIVSTEIEPVLDKWVQLKTIDEDASGKIKSSLRKIIKAGDGQQKRIRGFEREINIFKEKENFFINTYEKQLSERTIDLEFKTEQLKDTVDEQEEKIGVLNRKVSGLLIANKKLEESNTYLQSIIDEQKQTIDKQMQGIIFLNSKVARQDEAISGLMVDNQNLQNDHQILQKDYQILQKDYQSLLRDNKKLFKENQELRSDVNLLLEGNKESEGQILKLSADLNHLTKQKAEMKSEIKAELLSEMQVQFDKFVEMNISAKQKK